MLLYDGDCGFCTRCARFLRRHVSGSAPVVAFQRADLAALGVTAQECATAVQWVSGGRVEAGPAAIAALLRTAEHPGWRAVGRVLATAPVLVVAWPVYRLVARHRHRLPGGTATCALPAAIVSR